MANNALGFSCILSKFYIKPQPSARVRELLKGCILSKFYIKPQPPDYLNYQGSVVSYRNSTSNHNGPGSLISSAFVVSYRNSTSNHNNEETAFVGAVLYLIEILHQTTTTVTICGSSMSCILSKFYIKPQLGQSYLVSDAVVSYRNSTSNHNGQSVVAVPDLVVSYRNSTSNHNLRPGVDQLLRVVSYRNSTSNHNSWQVRWTITAVVSYRNSTSNHNVGPHID